MKKLIIIILLSLFFIQIINSDLILYITYINNKRDKNKNIFIYINRLIHLKLTHRSPRAVQEFNCEPARGAVGRIAAPHVGHKSRGCDTWREQILIVWFPPPSCTIQRRPQVRPIYQTDPLCQN